MLLLPVWLWLLLLVSDGGVGGVVDVLGIGVVGAVTRNAVVVVHVVVGCGVGYVDVVGSSMNGVWCVGIGVCDDGGAYVGVGVVYVGFVVAVGGCVGVVVLLGVVGVVGGSVDVGVDGVGVCGVVAVVCVVGVDDIIVG